MSNNKSKAWQKTEWCMLIVSVCIAAIASSTAVYAVIVCWSSVVGGK